MASAWGDSWGISWGDSWGAVSPVPSVRPAYLTWGDVMRQRAQQERDEEETLQFIAMQNNYLIAVVPVIAGAIQ